jgi:SNF2 family DNA or RNA helicase
VAYIVGNRTQSPEPITPTLTLAPHQEVGRQVANVRDRYGFFYDTRTGKTPLALSIIHDSLVDYPQAKWLVICPLILIENAWLEDAARFFPADKYPQMKIVNCHASTKDKRLARMQERSNIYITNTESFVNYKEYFDRMGFTGCIVDESSDMKSPRSKVSKAIVEFAHSPGMKRFYLLSGTPAPNGEWEYFMQMRAIDYFCMPESYNQFKNRYFVNLSYNPQFEKLMIRTDKQQELVDIIKQHAMYVDKEDVLDLPGRTFVEVPLQMPDALRTMYNKMKREMYVEVQDELKATETTQITAGSAAAKLNKLRQITSGFIISTAAVKYNQVHTDANLQEWHLLDNYRFQYLLAHLVELERAGEQAIIWCNYHKEFDIISEMLGVKCVCVYGKTSLVDKTENIRKFKNKGVQFLVANPASADKGLTLTNCCTAIYFSIGWSYELYKQSAERIYGAKSIQPKHCTYYIYEAANTVDETIYRQVLEGKQQLSHVILDCLK